MIDVLRVTVGLISQRDRLTIIGGHRIRTKKLWDIVTQPIVNPAHPTVECGFAWSREISCRITWIETVDTKAMSEFVLDHTDRIRLVRRNVIARVWCRIKKEFIMEIVVVKPNDQVGTAAIQRRMLGIKQRGCAA